MMMIPGYGSHLFCQVDAAAVNRWPSLPRPTQRQDCAHTMISGWGCSLHSRSPSTSEYAVSAAQDTHQSSRTPTLQPTHSTTSNYVSSVQSAQQFSQTKSVKGQRGKTSLESCSKLTATDGRGAKVKWQWVPDNWSCDEEAPPYKSSCTGSWNEQIAALGWVETTMAWIVSDCTGKATEVSRLRHWQPTEDVMKSWWISHVILLSTLHI